MVSYLDGVDGCRMVAANHDLNAVSSARDKNDKYLLRAGRSLRKLPGSEKEIHRRQFGLRVMDKWD